MASQDAGGKTDLSDVLKLLYSSGDKNEGSVDIVCVQHEGSHPKCVGLM